MSRSRPERLVRITDRRGWPDAGDAESNAVSLLSAWLDLYARRHYSKVKTTISEALPTRMGGPHVPAPVDV